MASFLGACGQFGKAKLKVTRAEHKADTSVKLQVTLNFAEVAKTPFDFTFLSSFILLCFQNTVCSGCVCGVDTRSVHRGTRL